MLFGVRCWRPSCGASSLLALLAVLSAFVCPLPARARPAVLRDIRPIIATDYTRLVIEVSRRVPYELRVVPANLAAGVPARIYVDLHQTRLAGVEASRLSPAGGPLVRLRGTQLQPNVTRLILDVPGLSEYRAFPLLDPFRLVVDVEGRARPVARPAPAPTPAKKVRRPLRQPAAPQRSEPRVPPRERPFTIVIDPGHGGRDPGARGVGGVLEKNIVLSVAYLLRPRLEAEGYQVILTRDRDVFLSLEERAALANATKADLFVSIHANASHNKTASGIETYYLSNSNDRATIRLAKMENHLAHMTGGSPSASDVSWIVSDMIQSYKIEESLKLAQGIQTALVDEASQGGDGVNDLGVKPGPFYVLVGAGMPAVLAEISFLTHQREGRRLATRSYQERLAEGLLRGIDEFVDNVSVATTL